jgi:urease accessory protein
MNDMTFFSEHIRAGTVTPFSVGDELVLSFEQRQKARQRATLASGREIGIQLVRGTILRGGDFLKSAEGEIVRVVAAPEQVSVARTQDSLLLARAAYHLGNRHVPLQVGAGFVQYLHDHVLDHMVESLGLRVTQERAPFEPEGGAYSESHGHRHGPSHSHDHEHDHGHRHEH